MNNTNEWRRKYVMWKENNSNIENHNIILIWKNNNIMKILNKEDNDEEDNE